MKRLGAKKIPVLLLTNATRYDLEDAKAASVVENLHRNKMNTKDMTAACVFLVFIRRRIKGCKVFRNIINHSEEISRICSSSR